MMDVAVVAVRAVVVLIVVRKRGAPGLILDLQGGSLGRLGGASEDSRGNRTEEGNLLCTVILFLLQRKCRGKATAPWFPRGRKGSEVFTQRK